MARVYLWDETTNTPALRAQNVSFYIDGQKMHAMTIQLPPLARGEMQTYVSPFPWNATTGEHDIQAKIDSDAQVLESNEANNSMFKVLSVNPVFSVPRFKPGVEAKSNLQMT